MEKRKNTSIVHKVEDEEDDRCMLDPGKICDNCFRCLDQDMPAYAKIKIERVILSGEYEDAAAMTETAFVQNDESADIPSLRVHPMTMPGYVGKRRIEN